MTETQFERPRGSVGTLVVAALHSRFANNVLLVAFAELLAEDQRYQMWYARTMKRNGVSIVDAWNAGELLSVLHRQCEEAWKTYLAEAQEAQRRRLLAPARNREERLAGWAAGRERTGRLVDVLAVVTDRLRHVQMTGEIGYLDPDMPPVELL